MITKSNLKRKKTNDQIKAVFLSLKVLLLRKKGGNYLQQTPDFMRRTLLVLALFLGALLFQSCASGSCKKRTAKRKHRYYNSFQYK